MQVLEVRSISISRSNLEVLNNISLTLGQGERIALMGANGAGKSTLSLALSGAIPLSSGTISGAYVGSVHSLLQRPESSFLCESVFEEVSLVPLSKGVSQAHVTEKVKQLLDLVGIGAEYYTRDPLHMSGGQQRRVAIAAILASEPSVLILDEPSVGLDAVSKQDLYEVIDAIAAAGVTVVTITHDPVEAQRIASRLIVISNGNLVYDGALVDVLADPDKAKSYGLEVAPAVLVLRVLSSVKDLDIPLTVNPDEILHYLSILVNHQTINTGEQGSEVYTHKKDYLVGGENTTDIRSLLPMSIDARCRLISALMVCLAALLSSSLVISGVVFASLVALMPFSSIRVETKRMIIRPLFVLAIMIIALQYVIGKDVSVNLIGEINSDSALFVGLHRVLQISSVLLVSVILTSATAPSDLGVALRRLFAPLKYLRIPVDAMSMIAATALSIVPALELELDRIRIARVSRGVEVKRGTIKDRLKDDMSMAAPLVTSSFRRAHLLADALTVRGVDILAKPNNWRATKTTSIDLLLLGSAIILILLAWYL